MELKGPWLRLASKTRSLANTHLYFWAPQSPRSSAMCTAVLGETSSQMSLILFEIRFSHNLHRRLGRSKVDLILV